MTEPILGSCGINREKAAWELKLDALACADPPQYAYGVQSTLYLFSAVGPATAVKGVSAILRGDQRGAFWAQQPGCGRVYYTLHSTKFNVFKARLAFDHWHLLAVASEPKLMTSFSQRALWREFSSPRFSTPVLRGWTQWIGKRLLESNLLRKLDCFRCEAAILGATSDDLDRIVKEGIQGKHLQFE